MFAKAGSSTTTSSSTNDKKVAKEVTLRKSDRRKLRQTVANFFASQTAAAGAGAAGGAEEEATEAVLDDVFLRGTRVARSLVTTIAATTSRQQQQQQERVVLYARQPSSSFVSALDKTGTIHDHDHDNVDDDNDNDHYSLRQWPYQSRPQVVWIEIDHGPSSSSSSQSQSKSHIPTVALLSVLPATWWTTTTCTIPALPLVTVPAAVSKYLCRGAHLMKAGMRRLVVGEEFHQSPTTSTTTRVVGICVQGNPQPLAVGWLDPSITNTSSTDFGPHTTGIGVHIVTCYGDDLWRTQVVRIPSSSLSSLSSSISAAPVDHHHRHDHHHYGSSSRLLSPFKVPYDAGNYGNPGFVHGQVVVSLEPKNSANDEEDEEKEATTTTTSPPLSPSDGTQGTTESMTAPNQSLQSSSSSPNEKNIGEAELAEQILHEAVCKALVRLKPQTDLPLPVSVFYAQHVLPQRRKGSTIQLKQTKYKKFGPYLQEQVTRGLLTVGPEKASTTTTTTCKDPLALLTGYDPRHVDLQPYRANAQTEQATERATNQHQQQERLVLLDLFVIPHHFVKLLRLDTDAVKAAHASSEARRNSGYLTQKEARVILDDYVTREQCIDPQQPARILLDGPLSDALYSKKNKTPPPPPASLTRKELATTWQAKLDAAYALVRMPGSIIVHMGRGDGPRVRVEVTARQSKKYVTKVRGMEAFGVDAAYLQGEITHRLACAAGVDTEPKEKLPKKDHVELVLQGHWAAELEALLTGNASLTQHGGVKDSPFGLPKNAIQVVLRKGVPARKK